MGIPGPASGTPLSLALAGSEHQEAESGAAGAGAVPVGLPWDILSHLAGPTAQGGRRGDRLLEGVSKDTTVGYWILASVLARIVPL